MNGYSAESYTVVWLFKAAIEAAGTTEGAAVRDALANLVVDGAFEGGLGSKGDSWSSWDD